MGAKRQSWAHIRFPELYPSTEKIVYVHTGSGTNSEGHLYWGSGRTIWNNDGDTAYLYDFSGKLVDLYWW